MFQLCALGPASSSAALPYPSTTVLQIACLKRAGKGAFVVNDFDAIAKMVMNPILEGIADHASSAWRRWPARSGADG